MMMYCQKCWRQLQTSLTSCQCGWKSSDSHPETDLVKLLERAQELIDPCYPDSHKAWQEDTRAVLAKF